MEEELKSEKTGEKQELEYKVGPGHPPLESRFTSENQPEKRGRPRGKRNFNKDFEIAAREVAKALSLGETPEPIYIELLKQGIESGLKGNYNFWKDIVEKIYGKEVERIEQEIYTNLISDEQFDAIIKKVVERRNNGK
jgi:hypothetical protein